MIRFITGKPGGGKSNWIMRQIYHDLNAGKDVFVNFEVVINDSLIRRKNLFGKPRPIGRLFYWDNLTQFEMIYHGEVYVDEAQSYFNSHEWMKLSKSLQVKFQQHRHHGLNITAGAQDWNRCNNIIRELAQKVAVVRCFFGLLFNYREYDPAEIDKAKRESEFSEWYFLNLDIARSYNTHTFDYKGDYELYLTTHFDLMERHVERQKLQLEGELKEYRAM